MGFNQLPDTAVWALAALLAFAAVHDVATFRIPNWLNGLIAGTFPAVAIVASAPVDWLGHAGAGLLTLAVGMVLFQFRTLGGGDVKLLAATAVWTGFGALLPFVLYVGLIGGGLTLLLLLLRRNLMPLAAQMAPGLSRAWPRVLTPGEKIPYGVAIAAAGILTALRAAALPAG